MPKLKDFWNANLNNACWNFAKLGDCIIFDIEDKK